MRHSERYSGTTDLRGTVISSLPEPRPASNVSEHSEHGLPGTSGVEVMTVVKGDWDERSVGSRDDGPNSVFGSSITASTRLSSVVLDRRPEPPTGSEEA